MNYILIVAVATLISPIAFAIVGRVLVGGLLLVSALGHLAASLLGVLASLATVYSRRRR